MIRAAALFATTLALATAGPAPEPLDLSGTWRFTLDPDDSLVHQPPDQWKLPSSIHLPGTVTSQGFGDVPSFSTRWTGDGWRYPELFREYQRPDNFKFPFFLQPPRYYVGPAWFQRVFHIPDAPAGHHTLLTLERVHWHSSVWIDGRPAGKGESLGTPHSFDLGSLTPGNHTLTLRIDNRMGGVNVGPLSHSMTDHTQGNWNGVVGRIALRTVPATHLASVRIDPSFASRSVRITVHTTGGTPGTARIRILPPATGGTHPATIEGSTEITEDHGGLTLALGGMARPWDEFHPNLFTAEVTLDTPGGTDRQTLTFGFRDPGHQDGRLALNGRPIFLRGTLECCIFPLTGHPPTDTASWKRILRICKDHGLNHIRFHSWCPPEAAFTAADEAGFYYQIECSSWPNQGASIGSGLPLDAWITAEADRMIECYGNHPSFLMLSCGNEPSGKNHAAWLQQFAGNRKAADPRRFHTTATGWPIRPGSDYHSSPDPRIQGWGQGLMSIINHQPPSTDFDWSGFVRQHPDAPVVSHEIGQWCAYPDFRDIDRFNGFLKARNYEIFRETARRNGLLPQARAFLDASGRLQTLCYKHDIEAALRTPGFGGFQLLDLHDFPGQGTATVGVLNALWQSKGYVTPREFARFCGPIVPLARMNKMIFTSGESIEADLELSHFGPDPLVRLGPTWVLSSDARPIASGTLPPRDLAPGALHPLGHISIPLPPLPASRLRLTVGATGKPFSNSWDLFVFPPARPEPVPAPAITRSLEATLPLLAAGKRVLWLAHGSVANDPDRPLTAGFSSIFWNTAWTNWQPPHTLGILCNPDHPALVGFPTQSHSNWQWWEIQQNAQPFLLTRHHKLQPIVQVIDDCVTNRKLAYVFEARVGPGKLVACAADLDTRLESRPAARHLRTTLVRYLDSPEFQPSTRLTPDDLSRLVTPPAPSR